MRCARYDSFRRLHRAALTLAAVMAVTALALSSCTATGDTSETTSTAYTHA